MSFHWYVLRVKPHKERAVFNLLQTREVESFFPVLKVEPKNPRSAKERPYFPGYLFVQADLDKLGANALSWVPGTHGLVTFGDVPAIVPVNLIQEIKHRLSEIETSGGLVLDSLTKGDHVRIISGLFEGYEAIFDARIPGSQRVQVLMSFLGNHPKPVKLDVADIEKLG